jgi:hypothetical protein
MSKENFERQAANLLNAIDLCFERTLVLPGLILLYAGIDAMAWLSKPNEADSVGDSFQVWVKTYLLRCHKGEVGTPDQVALDLFGARCALLHAQIAESDLSRKAKAREVHYRFANGTGLVPVEGMNAPVLNIFVDPNWLRKSFESAVEAFGAAIDADAQLQARVYQRASRHFSEIKFL